MHPDHSGFFYLNPGDYLSRQVAGLYLEIWFLDFTQQEPGSSKHLFFIIF